ncbi:fibronectin type III domain-containing protein [Cryptosporangium phraense]|uniref:Fibronectin type III domain-containing protein n=1 Tax=Cryptosporangium phraense TaxID=2593070 RepID=A0A545AVZ5_9ACTN|nr:fibronectin type III domain-containing protein [Cryptosporangium phraense]TQS45507.1 fibronectin type III domain-containing protein [Cryptosporangium phraense]
MRPPSARTRRALAALALVGALFPTAHPAVAAGTAATKVFTADAQPTWQTNGTVWAVTIVGGVVYIGGNFSAVRPPGAPAGTREVARDNLAAFDARTGNLLPLSHTFASPRYAFSVSKPDVSCDVDWDSEYYSCDTIYRIKASPDGSKIYVSGDFSSVDGQARSKVAAFPTAGAASANLPLDRTFAPSGINSRVRALAVGANSVYVGGIFTQVGGQSRERLAALSARTGVVLPFAARADGEVLALSLAANGHRLVVGGNYDTLNGVAQHALGAVDPATGASTAWAWRGVPRTSYITDMAVDRNAVYVSSNGEGTWDGRAAVDPLTGVLKWFDSCLGATWALALHGDLLYSGSHAHNCNDTAGGFPEQATDLPEPRYYRLMAQTTRGSRTTIQYWFPSTNGGDPNVPATRSPSKLGPRAMASDGRSLWVGGQFTTVNNVPQQGLTRFTTTATSKAPSTPLAPTIANSGANAVTVTWRGVEDLDDPVVTYEIYRGSSMVYRGRASAKPWETSKSYQFTDRGLTAGTSVQYRVRAVDGRNTAGAFSPIATATVGQSAEPAETWPNDPWTNTGWQPRQRDSWFDWGGW